MTNGGQFEWTTAEKGSDGKETVTSVKMQINPAFQPPDTATSSVYHPSPYYPRPTDHHLNTGGFVFDPEEANWAPYQDRIKDVSSGDSGSNTTVDRPSRLKALLYRVSSPSSSAAG
jgi:hypothetical protein